MLISVLAPLRFLNRFGGFCANCSCDESKLSNVKEHDCTHEPVNGDVPDLMSKSEGTEVNAVYGY